MLLRSGQRAIILLALELSALGSTGRSRPVLDDWRLLLVLVQLDSYGARRQLESALVSLMLLNLLESERLLLACLGRLRALLVYRCQAHRPLAVHAALALTRRLHLVPMVHVSLTHADHGLQLDCRRVEQADLLQRCHRCGRLYLPHARRSIVSAADATEAPADLVVGMVAACAALL